MRPAYKLRIILMFLGLLLGYIAFGASKEYTKTIKKEFAITADGTTRISNKYGKVVIKTWDRDRVKIEVRIVARASSEEKAQDIFDRITIQFANQPDQVSAETEISSSKSFWDWSWMGSSRIDYSINYDVTMPPSCRLDLSNKYGDTFVAPLAGSAALSVKYGNFQVEGIDGNLSLYLGYGNGTVAKARDIVAEGSYCQLRLKEAKDVDITSKYSKIRMESVGDIKSTSQYDSYKIGGARDIRNIGKYDNFEIGYSDNLFITTKYADIFVEKLGNSADLDLKYGGATINQVAKGFSEVRLIGNYADYKIKVEDGAIYQVDAVADYAGISYPNTLQVINEREKGTYHEVNGYVGRKDAASVIRAKLDYGGLKVW